MTHFALDFLAALGLKTQKFFVLQTERCCDTLNIYDGAGTCGGFITDFYGRNGAYRSNVPNLVASQSNQMTLFFYTDGSVTSSGWNATVSMSDEIGNCGETLTASSGKLYHPGSPGTYPNNQDCGYLIQVTAGNTVQLSWDTFNVSFHICTVFENHSIVSFKIASEASYIYILSGQKLIESGKNGPFWRVFENLKLAAIQCYQTGQF